MEIFGLNLVKSLIIIIVVLLYWKFVYYRYHRKLITPLSFVFVGGAIGLYGVYCWLIDKTVYYQNVKFLYFISVVFGIVSFSLVLVAMSKHKLKKDIDITLTWTDRILGRPFVYFMILIAFPAFFMIMLGTYVLLGKEHIILWIMIFLAWIASDIRLYRKEVMR